MCYWDGDDGAVILDEDLILNGVLNKTERAEHRADVREEHSRKREKHM